MKRINLYLWNPFVKLGGYQALLLGMLIMGITAVVAFFSHTHFDGALDAHGGSSAPLYIFIAESLMAWFIMALALHVTGLVLSSSKVRWIDVAGNTALARIPFFFIALLMFWMPELDLTSLDDLDFYSDSILKLSLLGMIMLVFAIWFVVWLYRGYSVACNLKGTKGLAGFIVAILAAEAVSKITFYYFYKIVI